MSEAIYRMISTRRKVGPSVLCPTSRHAMQIAELLAEGVAPVDPKHAADSIADTVTALWKTRTGALAMAAEVERLRAEHAKLHPQNCARTGCPVPDWCQTKGCAAHGALLLLAALSGSPNPEANRK
jgi:hypothetical protein